MPHRFALTTALAALVALPALAEGISVYDLGEMPTRELCMQRANKVMSTYFNEHGGYQVQRTDWVIYGWDLEPGDQDVSILCPIFRDDLVAAMMVVHGETTDEERLFTADELSRLWSQ